MVSWVAAAGLPIWFNVVTFFRCQGKKQEQKNNPWWNKIHLMRRMTKCCINCCPHHNRQLCAGYHSGHHTVRTRTSLPKLLLHKHLTDIWKSYYSESPAFWEDERQKWWVDNHHGGALRHHCWGAGISPCKLFSSALNSGTYDSAHIHSILIYKINNFEMYLKLLYNLLITENCV